MQVKDFLPRFAAIVDHQSKSAVGEAELSGDGLNFFIQLCENLGWCFEKCWVVGLWADQDMGGRFGVDVVEAEDVVRFVAYG